jgi:hypothetical protein
MTPIRWLAAAGIATTSALALALPASAQVIYQEHEQGTTTEFFPPGEVCDDLDLRLDITFRNTIQFVQRKPSDIVPYFGARFHETVVWTNVATGKSFTIHNRVNDKDLQIVDNGDGTITIDAMATGGLRITDDDGKHLFSNAGQIRYRIVIDLGGTPLDIGDDTELSFEITRESNGTNDTADRDFCDDLTEFTT